jgi:hypothetical protein
MYSLFFFRSKCKKAASNTTKDREKAYAAASNVRDTAAKNAEKEAAKVNRGRFNCAAAVLTVISRSVDTSGTSPTANFDH